MKQDIKIKLTGIKTNFKKITPVFARHGAFLAVLAVLIIYLFIVWRISGLASSEPSDSALTAAETSSAVPKIDASAIKQIQSLEQNSAQVQALFNQARNNPFHE